MPRGDGTWGSNNPTGNDYERLITIDPDAREHDSFKRYLEQLEGYSELKKDDHQYATFETIDAPEGYEGDGEVTRIYMPAPTHNSKHHVQWRLWKLRSGGAIQDLRLDKLIDEPEPEPEAEEEAEDDVAEEGDE